MAADKIVIGNPPIFIGCFSVPLLVIAGPLPDAPEVKFPISPAAVSKVTVPVPSAHPACVISTYSLPLLLLIPPVMPWTFLTIVNGSATSTLAVVE